MAPNAQPYQVNISAAATQGSILAGVALPPSVVLTSANNTFNFKLNALTTATITLDPGTYDPAALAAAIQQQGEASNNIAAMVERTAQASEQASAAAQHTAQNAAQLDEMARMQADILARYQV